MQKLIQLYIIGFNVKLEDSKNPRKNTVNICDLGLGKVFLAFLEHRQEKGKN